MWFFSLTFFMLHLLPITLLPHPVWGAHFAGIHGRARWRERWRCRDSPASSSNQLFRHDCVCIVLYQKALRKVSASGCVSVLWSLIHRHAHIHTTHTTCISTKMTYTSPPPVLLSPQLSFCLFKLWIFSLSSFFFDSRSLTQALSQGSVSQMSPLVTASLIDLRTAKGIDLKHAPRCRKSHFCLLDC